jgi:LPS export ABC transporter protein LptC
VLKWQRRTRSGLAVFGIVLAIVAYAAIGERRSVTPPERPSRLDPRAILESAGASFQQFSAARQDYVIEAERQLTYEGGATKFVGVTIKVGQRAGRDFVISGREAQAGGDQVDMQITGDVKLSASDGFSATTDHVTFNKENAMVRAAGPVSFQKGRMSGSGTGMTYNQVTDVLTLAEDVRVAVTDETGRPTTEFAATSATLARVENYLALKDRVHALRGEQILEANQGRALLSEDGNLVTAIELRGNARVAGGESFDVMTARDIDLDYADGGIALERVALSGNGTITMRGEGEGQGHQFAGDSLELTFAGDGSVTRAAGRTNIHVALPTVGGAAARTIEAQSFDATGESGRGLSAARFEGQVEYREGGDTAAARRLVRSGALDTVLSDDRVTAAVFTAGVTFEAQGLRALADRVDYDPVGGALRLRGAGAGQGPRVEHPDIEVDADAIDVTLEGPQMMATGNVTTLLHPRSGSEKGGSPESGGRLPGLLQTGQAANVRAESLDYQGMKGTAAYKANAILWQGDTTIQADAITLDQRRAGLVAVGNARSNLPFDDDTSIGRASEIRYDDATRRIIFGAPERPEVKTAGAAASAAGVAPVAALSQLSGPQGDLGARRIEVVLAPDETRIDRLEAFQDVTVRLDTRVATGDRLSYFAQDGRYVITGVATVPVVITERCRETTGRTVTFFRSGDRIVVDGNEEVRTQSRRGVSCPESPAP